MTESAIKAKIEAVVQGNYSAWTIGITDDPDRRKGEHGNPPGWRHWYADTEQIARDVEKHFLAKDMKGDTGGGFSPNYVYIF